MSSFGKTNILAKVFSRCPGLKSGKLREGTTIETLRSTLIMSQAVIYDRFISSSVEYRS